MKHIFLLLLVPSLAFAAKPGTGNPNTDDAATLAANLNGVGATRAAAIVTEREKGLFADCPDLAKRVKGVGPKVCETNPGLVFTAAH